MDDLAWIFFLFCGDDGADISFRKGGQNGGRDATYRDESKDVLSSRLIISNFNPKPQYENSRWMKKSTIYLYLYPKFQIQTQQI